MLIVFALKETNHIVVFFTIHLPAAVLCVQYTITVHVVMFNIRLGLGGGGGGGGGGELFQGRIIYPGII